MGDITEKKFPHNQRLSQIIESSTSNTVKHENEMIDSFEKVFDDEELGESLDVESSGPGSIDDFLNEYLNDMKTSPTSKKIKVETNSPSDPRTDTGVCESKSREEKVQRVRSLINFPADLSRYLNSGDETKMRELIFDKCCEDCKFKTAAMPKEAVGREVIVECFLALTRSMPDYIMQFRTPTTHKRVIMASFESSGTRVVHDAAEHLFDHLQYGRDDNVSFVRAQQLVRVIEASGKRACFRGKSVMHLIVNNDMTHIEKIIIIRKSIVVMPAKEDDDDDDEL